MTKNNNESEKQKTAKSAAKISVSGLGARIDAVSKVVGTRSDAASSAGVSDDMLYRYIREDSPPSFLAMAGLTHAAGVSLDWLATGEGPMYVGVRSSSSDSGSMNREIMSEVIEVVLGELEAQGKTLPPGKMAQLMLLIHDEIQESEQTGKGVDKAKVIRLIKLAS